jgi:hypothetical protein
MKAAWFPPLKLASESCNGFQNLLSRKRVSRSGGKTTEQFASDLFEHIVLQVLPYVGTPIKEHRQIRRLLHSPLYVYYPLDEKRDAIEILHFWHIAGREPKF